jgi:hypothetical protein
MPIRHKFNSPIDDEGVPAGAVKPSNWNEDHDIDGLLGALVSLAAQPNVVPYVDAGGGGSTIAVSDFVRSVMAAASAAAFLAAIGGISAASPALTGTPTAPTPAGGDNSTKIATTAFVNAAIAALIGSAPTALDTLNELAAALGNDSNFSATVTNALALKAPLNSPGFTGTVTAPTVAGSTDNTTKVATTAFVQAVIAALATVARTGAYSDLTGKPTLGTAAALDVGTTASKVVQLTAAGKYPAVDGSLITGVSASLTSGRQVLGANVALGAAGANADLLSAALTQGTYLVVAKAAFKDPGASCAFSARIYDGTTVWDDSGYVHSVTGSARVQCCCLAIVTVGAGGATVKLQGRNATTANGSALFNDTGDANDTSLSWVKIAA